MRGSAPLKREGGNRWLEPAGSANTWRVCEPGADRFQIRAEGRLLSTIDFAFLLGRGEPISTTVLVRACDTFEQIFGGAQELASEQRSSGSAARGGAYWPYADQGNPLQWRAILERMEERGSIGKNAHQRRLYPRSRRSETRGIYCDSC